jgi:hypothetical protein
MESGRKKSLEPFHYDNTLEEKLGPYLHLSFLILFVSRTGSYVRKSGIAKDFDGLYGVNEYWETTTEKTYGTNDDGNTSMTSDIYVGIIPVYSPNLV